MVAVFSDTEDHMKCHMVEVMEVILGTEGSQDTEVMLNMAVMAMVAMAMAMASSSMESMATMASIMGESTRSGSD